MGRTRDNMQISSVLLFPVHLPKIIYPGAKINKMMTRGKSDTSDNSKWRKFYCDIYSQDVGAQTSLREIDILKINRLSETVIKRTLSRLSMIYLSMKNILYIIRNKSLRDV